MLAALPRMARLYVRLMGDPRVSVGPKLIVVAALAYLISPLDLVPDLLVPVLGQLDDIAILGLAFAALMRLSPPEVVAEHDPARVRRGG
jgi:uncharacterized membrane protein YkvA (DUF1232 family)